MLILACRSLVFVSFVPTTFLSSRAVALIVTIFLFMRSGDWTIRERVDCTASESTDSSAEIASWNVLVRGDSRKETKKTTLRRRCSAFSCFICSHSLVSLLWSSLSSSSLFFPSAFSALNASHLGSSSSYLALRIMHQYRGW